MTTFKRLTCQTCLLFSMTILQAQRHCPEGAASLRLRITPGLLTTALFRCVFISYAHRYVILEPR